MKNTTRSKEFQHFFDVDSNATNVDYVNKAHAIQLLFKLDPFTNTQHLEAIEEFCKTFPTYMEVTQKKDEDYLPLEHQLEVISLKAKKMLNNIGILDLYSNKEILVYYSCQMLDIIAYK